MGKGAGAKHPVLAGESVVVRRRRHWSVFFWPGVLVAAGVPLMVAGALAVEMAQWLYFLAGLFLAVPGFGMMLPAVVDYLTHSIILTNKRLTVTSGLLRRSSFEILLTKVESIEVEQPLLGRVLGYGSVVVRGTGGSKEAFPLVGDPVGFRTLLQEQVDQSVMRRV